MRIVSYNKEGITFTEVINDKNLKVVFANLGASIFSIKFDNYLLTRNVKNIKDFFTPSIYYGKTIGRVANRMKGHAFVVNGERYEVEPNEGENVLHGGNKGLSNQFFELNTIKGNDKVEVIYTKKVGHLEDGYPGNLEVEVKYIVGVNDNEIDIEFKAKSDMDTTLALTNHTYFTLGCKSIEGLTLQINGNNYLETDENTLLPTNRRFVSPVMDFRNPKKITKDINGNYLHTPKHNGYDHYFYFLDRDLNKKNVSLSNAKLQMDIYTDFQGVQIYTSGYSCGCLLYPEANYLFDSIAIEPSDTFRYLHLLKKDEIYSRRIRYVFFIKENNDGK